MRRTEMTEASNTTPDTRPNPKPSPGRIRVGVIGVGPSGLVAMKELLEVGLDVVAFEEQTHLGGVFAKTYDSLVLTGSDVNIMFSSFPDVDPEQPRIWTAREYVDYLRRYAEHFGLLPHIRFSTTVRNLSRDADGDRWVLMTQHTGSDTATTEHFDRMVICSGSHSKPVQPDIPGAGEFVGDIVHSSEFRNAKSFRGKRVLVLGLGESGSDIALEVAKVADSTAIACRKGPGYVIPRYFGGTVSDLDTNRCHHSIPYQLGNSAMLRLKRRLEGTFVHRNDDMSILEMAKELNQEGGFPWQRRFGSKSTNFIEAVLYHGAVYRPGGVTRLEPDRAVFPDGSTFACDTVVLCTGFKPDLSFLEGQDMDLLREASVPRRLFRRIFHPRLGDTIAWVGLVRPGVGSIPPCAEMQARYIAQVFSGTRSLPAVAKMEEDIRLRAELDFDQYPLDAARIQTLTDYFRYMKSMAELIGCEPPLSKLFLTRPGLWAKVMFAPLSPIQFRMAGPGRTPEAAARVLRALPTMPKVVLACELVTLLASKLLSYRPNEQAGELAREEAAHRQADLHKTPEFP